MDLLPAVLRDEGRWVQHLSILLEPVVPPVEQNLQVRHKPLTRKKNEGLSCCHLPVGPISASTSGRRLPPAGNGGATPLSTRIQDTSTSLNRLLLNIFPMLPRYAPTQVIAPQHGAEVLQMRRLFSDHLLHLPMIHHWDMGRLRQRPRLRQVSLACRCVVLAVQEGLPGLLPQFGLCLSRNKRCR